MKNKIINCICILIVCILVFSTNLVFAAGNGLSSIDVTPKISDLSRDEDDDKIYRVKVSNETTEVTVNAKPSNNKATVEISGNKSLQVGTNKVTVKVNEPDGTSETYTIYVRRADKSIASKTIVPNVEDKNNPIVENNASTNENIKQDSKSDEEIAEQTLLANDINNSENEEENNLNEQNTNETQEKKEDKKIIYAVVIVLVAIILIAIIKRK